MDPFLDPDPLEYQTWTRVQDSDPDYDPKTMDPGPRTWPRSVSTGAPRPIAAYYYPETV